MRPARPIADGSPGRGLILPGRWAFVTIGYQSRSSHHAIHAEVTPMQLTYEFLAKRIDHSLLGPTLTDAELEEGCRLAATYRVASVCIKPHAVKLATRILAG